MRHLPSVTLLGIDCLNVERLALAMDICQKDFTFDAVKLLTSLPTNDPRAVAIEPINSIEAYSTFAIAKLDAHVETEHVLIVQYDGFILNPQKWDDAFLTYDYIGAPWLVRPESLEHGLPEELMGKEVVGNGGFCLRSKRFVSLCAQWERAGMFTRHHPEDVVLAVHHRERFEEAGMRFAPVEVARTFSFESQGRPNNVWNGQFGFHGLRWTDISAWLKEHPEYPIDNTLTS